MLRVVETFSGIGAQAKALSNIGCDFEVVATSDWDITAIIAYDYIHNGKPNLDKYIAMSKEELLDKVKGLTLSADGKKPMTRKAIENLSKSVLERLCSSIDRTNNLISITDIRGKDLPKKIDLLTYSFPCQDLSLAHSWHGETGGINRDAQNRSSMLWEVERIIKECYAGENDLPRFLLMENVPNILAKKHEKNFQEWKKSLNNMGYYNKVYKLLATNFGSYQERQRAYMISILTNGDKKLESRIDKYFAKNDLSLIKTKNKKSLKGFLCTDYENVQYYNEAILSCPNDTPSRRRIYEDNAKLFDGKEYAKTVHTITTKQDRHPNSGVIKFNSGINGKSSFRYLTPRECLKLMGFEELDYENIVHNNFPKRDTGKAPFFTTTKIVKLAGNSIVVNVLESVFEQINYINKHILK